MHTYRSTASTFFELIQKPREFDSNFHKVLYFIHDEFDNIFIMCAIFNTKIKTTLFQCHYSHYYPRSVSFKRRGEAEDKKVSGFLKMFHIFAEKTRTSLTLGGTSSA